MEQSKMIIKRNLLFWGKYGIQMTAILIGFVLLYGLFFSMGESADSGFWQSANFFAVLIGIMFNYIGPISYGGAYIPMVLSFGSGRKEAAWGAQLLYAGYAVTAYLFILFTGYMSAGRMDGFKNILIAEAFVLCIAFGQICAVLHALWKKGNSSRHHCDSCSCDGYWCRFYYGQRSGGYADCMVSGTVRQCHFDGTFDRCSCSSCAVCGQSGHDASRCIEV